MSTFSPIPLAADAHGSSATQSIIDSLADFLENFELPPPYPFAPDKVGAHARIARGWLEQQIDSTKPTIGLDCSASGTRSGRLGRELYTIGTPADDQVIVRYVVPTAVIEQPVAINVWAKTKQERARIVQLVELALKGEDPIENGSQVRLNPAAYYGLPMSFYQSDAFRFMDSEAAVGGDEFRAVGEATATVNEVVVIEGPRIRSLDVLANLIEMRLDFVAANAETWKIVDLDA